MNGADEWLLNPRLQVQVEGKELERITVRAPVRGRAAQVLQLTDPALVLPIVLRRTRALVDTLSSTDLAMLCAAGVLVRPEEVVDEVLFRVDAPKARVSSRSERANQVWVQRGGANVPPSLLARVGTSQLCLAGGPVLWTEDSARGVLVPVWFDTELTRALESFAEGGPPHPDVKPILSGVGAWTTRKQKQRRVHRWQARLRKAAQRFRHSAYAVVSTLLPAYLVAALARYVRSLVREGYLPLEDGQSRRYYRHNEPVVSLFHRELSPTVEHVVGTRIKPSYCYLGAYEPGAELKSHLDREQCEFSVSLQVDYDPAPRRTSPWPLWMHPKGKEPVPIHLAAGEALFYKGRELPHFRHPLPSGHRSISIFLHYVHADFPGSLR